MLPEVSAEQKKTPTSVNPPNSGTYNQNIINLPDLLNQVHKRVWMRFQRVGRRSGLYLCLNSCVWDQWNAVDSYCDVIFQNPSFR